MGANAWVGDNRRTTNIGPNGPERHATTPHSATRGPTTRRPTARPVRQPVDVIGLVMAIVVMSAGVGWRMLRRRSWRPRSFDPLSDSDVAAALEEASRSLRTGASLRTALGQTCLPIAPALAEGYPLTEVADRWALRADTPAQRLAATAIAVAVSTGGPQARALDAAAHALRERLDALAEVQVQSAQARLSGAVIACLPAGFLAFTLVADRRTAGILLGTPPGWLCLVVGLALDLAGFAWIRSTVRRAL
jgi:tight adherence protein B